MISGTVTDASGRILSGQTVEAFWNSVRHAKPATIGLNCALGAALMRPYIAELSKICDANICVYPNAGLPNPMSDTGFDETPPITSSLLKEFAEAGYVAAAPRPITSAPLPNNLKTSRRACRRCLITNCVCPDWSRQTSKQRRSSLTSASAPTSPGRRRLRA
jgi:hypothetical protein